MPSKDEIWARIERDARDTEHHLEDIVRIVKSPRKRLEYEDMIDQLREIRRHAHQNAEDIAISPVKLRESSPHIPEGLQVEEFHLGLQHECNLECASGNPSIDWAKHAHWFEAEGTRRRLPRKGEWFRELTVITQDLKRFDVVLKLCNELRQAGFTPRIRRKNRDGECNIDRMEQQICYLERILPHLTGSEATAWTHQTLQEMAKRKRTRPRIPFQCPDR